MKRIELEPGKSMTYQSTYISEMTEGYSNTITEGYKLTDKQTAKLKLQIGLSIPLDHIKASGESSVEDEISSSETISKTASETWSKTYSYLEQVTATWPLSNNAATERRIYQFNYRQKFRLYFTTQYDYYFTTTVSHGGLFNRDTHYKHEPMDDKFKSVQTRFFFLPVDLPTLGFTEYHNSSDGAEFPTTLIEDNVLYL